MALAAYNCGEGRILKETGKRGRKYMDNFWDIYERLPRETARYVPRFLATLHIIENPEKYGFRIPEPNAPVEFESVQVRKQISLKKAAACIGTTEKRLIDLNPSLRRKILPPEVYFLKVPPHKGRILLANLNSIPVSKYRAKSKGFYHKIRPGETLSAISKRYKVKAKKIARANNIKVNSTIIAGRKLKIPGGKKKIFKTYLVKYGDTPFEIAIKHKMSLKKFLNINGLNKKSKIYPGQKLLVV